jgi:hypothetical protein
LDVSPGGGGGRRNKTNSTYIGTWNVMTHSKQGKTQELAEQIVNTHLEEDAIQETRWNVNCPIKINIRLLY